MGTQRTTKLRRKPNGKETNQQRLARSLDVGENWQGVIISKKVLEIYEGIPKALWAALVQARTGKIALKAYLHAINKAEDNKCECGEVQTVKHILMRVVTEISPIFKRPVLFVPPSFLSQGRGYQ
jgi:hypothetical protein